MYVIGITGGVGSGKTAAAHKLAELTGAQALIADEIGHLVMERGRQGYGDIVEAFGEGILDGRGEIDRGRLSALVFSDAEKLERLNRIVHPAVKEYLQGYLDSRREQEGYLILETAIMFETGCDALCDEVWYIYVPTEMRIERLAKTRGYSRQKSLAVMGRQLGEEEYRRRCQREIRNDGTVHELEERLSEMVILQQRDVEVSLEKCTDAK